MLIKSVKRTFVFLLFVLTMGGEVCGQLNTNRLLQIGRNAVYFEDYVLGMQYFNRVINVKPYLAEPYYYRGIAKYYLDDLKGAAVDCEIAYGINPFLIEAYNLHGIIRLRQGDSEAALTDFERGLELEKDNINLLLNSGIANINLEHYDDAINYCDRVLDYDKRNVPAILYKGIALVQKGDSVLAMTEFVKAGELNSYSADAQVYQGMLNYQMKNYTEALKNYTRLVELRPKDANVYVNRAITYYNLDNYDAAFKDLDDALMLDDKNVMAYQNRGMLRAEVGRITEATEDFGRVLALDSDNDMALMNRALLYIQIGEMHNALADLNIVISRHPEFGPAYYQRAIVKRNLNDPKGSEIDYMTAYTFEQERIKRGLAAGEDSTQVASGGKNESSHGKREKRASRSRNDDSMDNYDKMVVVSDFADNDDKLKQDREQIRGRVQDRDVIIDLEPVFELSFVSSDTLLQRPKYYAKSVEDFNNSNTYQRRLMLTNRESNMSQAENLDYYNEIRELSNQIESGGEAVSQSLYFVRGVLQSLVMSYNQAICDYNVCILRNPHDINALLNRAATRFKVVEIIRSMDTQPEAPTMGAQSDKSSATQINTTYLDLELILADLSKIIEIEPKLPVAYYNMSLVMCLKKDFASALSLIDKSVELDDSFAEAYYNRGIINIYLGNDVQGSKDLSKAGELGMYKAYNVLKRYLSDSEKEKN
ncbi:MAG: tetratricopeptide repeat protein [Marinilabiliaceae bacterium]|nr:tetratricopeptide repeat protein [Marinilabiliaceae bacterium]